MVLLAWIQVGELSVRTVVRVGNHLLPLGRLQQHWLLHHLMSPAPCVLLPKTLVSVLNVWLGCDMAMRLT